MGTLGFRRKFNGCFVTNRFLVRKTKTQISVENKINAFASKLRAAVSAPLFNYNFA
jgi:hypothetical protein